MSCAKPPVIVIHTFLHPPLASGSSSVPLVTRVRNNGAHLNFITQREESTNTKPAALHTSNTHTGFHQTLQKKKNFKRSTSDYDINIFRISPKSSILIGGFDS